ncbi:MAG: hypothetical protein NVSMB9_07150 [Isosphaeraceae bacterium]
MAARKVAYVTPLFFGEESYLGGGERFPWNLARGVGASSGGRYEVELISFSTKPSRREVSEGVSLRLLTAASLPKNPLDIVSWEIPGALADADLVHLHQAYTRCSEVGLLVAKQQRKPICVTDHGGMSSPLVKHLGLLDLVDQVIAYSDFGASLYQTNAPITVVKGGVDTSRFTPPSTVIRREHVLYVGRLLPHKGIDRLIEALPAGLPLKVCGRPYHGPYFERLQAAAQGKDVEFIMNADDDRILDLYRRAWVNVLPSVHVDCYGHSHEAPELMGLTLLEAMACGTPVIASRAGAMPEFVRHGETGFLFDELSDLSERIRSLATEPRLADHLGAQGRLSVEREYDHRVAGAKIATIYDRLIEQSARKELAA